MHGRSTRVADDSYLIFSIFQNLLMFFSSNDPKVYYAQLELIPGWISFAIL